MLSFLFHHRALSLRSICSYKPNKTPLIGTLMHVKNSGNCVYQILRLRQLQKTFLRETGELWDGIWIMGRMRSLCCAIRVHRPVVLSLPRVRPLPPLCLFLQRLFLIGRCTERGPVCVNRRWWALLRGKGQPPAAIRQTLLYCFLLSRSLSLSQRCANPPLSSRADMLPSVCWPRDTVNYLILSTRRHVLGLDTGYGT